jgi:hypothetical protein
MAFPIMTERLETATKHLTLALQAICDARNCEIGAARATDGEARRKRHMLANRALIVAEKLARDALEVVSC